jgi:hypothetical protein
MASQGPALLATFQADDKISLDRAADRNGRGAFSYGFWHFTEFTKRVVHIGDQGRQLVCRHFVMAQVSGHNLGRALALRTWFILNRHRLLPLYCSELLRRASIGFNCGDEQIIFDPVEKGHASSVLDVLVKAGRSATYAWALPHYPYENSTALLSSSNGNPVESEKNVPDLMGEEGIGSIESGRVGTIAPFPVQNRRLPWR